MDRGQRNAALSPSLDIFKPGGSRILADFGFSVLPVKEEVPGGQGRNPGFPITTPKNEVAGSDEKKPVNGFPVPSFQGKEDARSGTKKSVTKENGDPRGVNSTSSPSTVSPQVQLEESYDFRSPFIKGKDLNGEEKVYERAAYRRHKGKPVAPIGGEQPRSRFAIDSAEKLEEDGCQEDQALGQPGEKGDEKKVELGGQAQSQGDLQEGLERRFGEVPVDAATSAPAVREEIADGEEAKMEPQLLPEHVLPQARESPTSVAEGKERSHRVDDSFDGYSTDGLADDDTLRTNGWSRSYNVAAGDDCYQHAYPLKQDVEDGSGVRPTHVTATGCFARAEVVSVARNEPGGQGEEAPVAEEDPGEQHEATDASECGVELLIDIDGLDERTTTPTPTDKEPVSIHLHDLLRLDASRFKTRQEDDLSDLYRRLYTCSLVDHMKKSAPQVWEDIEAGVDTK